MILKQINDAVHNAIVFCSTCGKHIHESPYQEIVWEMRNTKAFPDWKYRSYKHWVENRDHCIIIVGISPNGGGERNLSMDFNNQALDERIIPYNLEFHRLVSLEFEHGEDHKDEILQLDDDFTSGIDFHTRITGGVRLV